MRKYFVMLTVFFILTISLVQTVAQSVTFHQNDQVVIKSGIAYAWLRSQPGSECACVEYVITSSKRVMRILDAVPTSDGIENWWHVSTISRPIKQGWVEEKSLTLLRLAPTPTITPNGTEQPRRFVTNAVQIREGVPFIWIRSQPSSAASVLQTVKFSPLTNQSQCLTIATIVSSVRWDGQQWWRELIPSNTVRSDIKSGWVEENSLVDCNPGASLTVTPTVSVTSKVAASLDVITPIPTTSTYAAYQPFEKGIMIWRQDTQSVYVLVNGGGPAEIGLSEYSALPEPTDVSPAGLYTPVNAFGKVWNEMNYGEQRYRDKLGWAMAREQGYTASISGYIVASPAKPDSVTDITLPDGRTVEIEIAFLNWHIK